MSCVTCSRQSDTTDEMLLSSTVVLRYPYSYNSVWDVGQACPVGTLPLFRSTVRFYDGTRPDSGQGTLNVWVFFSVSQHPKSGLGRRIVEASRSLTITHTKPGNIPLNEWSDRCRQHTTCETNNHALCGIRTRNPSNQAAAGHRDRLDRLIGWTKLCRYRHIPSLPYGPPSVLAFFSSLFFFPSSSSFMHSFLPLALIFVFLPSFLLSTPFSLSSIFVLPFLPSCFLSSSLFPSFTFVFTFRTSFTPDLLLSSISRINFVYLTFSISFLSFHLSLSTLLSIFPLHLFYLCLSFSFIPKFHSIFFPPIFPFIPTPHSCSHKDASSGWRRPIYAYFKKMAIWI